MYYFCKRELMGGGKGFWRASKHNILSRRLKAAWIDGV